MTIESQATSKFAKWLIGLIREPADGEQRPLDDLDKAVYQFLLDMSLGQKRAATLREVVDMTQCDLTLPPDMKLEWNDEDRDHCRKMWNVVQHLNDSGEIHSQVYIKDYTYGISLKQESNEYIRKLVNEGGRKIARAFRLYLKGLKDGELDLLNGDEPIEAFLDWLMLDKEKAKCQKTNSAL